MKLCLKVTLMCAVTAVLPFMTGCLGGTSLNPVADSTFVEAEAIVPDSAPTVMGARFIHPTPRRYTFAAPPCRVSHRVRKGSAHGSGSLKLRLMGVETADQVLITFENLRVKSVGGTWISLNLGHREIDLARFQTVAEVLAAAELPDGVYQRFEIAIRTARVVINGTSHVLRVPSNRIRFRGSFEIRAGFTTELTMRFRSKILRCRWRHGDFFVMRPVIRIASSLVPRASPHVDGDIAGFVVDFVTRAPLAGVSVLLAGTPHNTLTAPDGSFSLPGVATGSYSVRFSHPSYIDNVATATVLAGQVADIRAELNPAVIRSTVGNTGWFSTAFPTADAHGRMVETAIETPVAIDFVSLAFVRAEISYVGEYSHLGSAMVRTFLHGSQQVTPTAHLGSWWVGDTAVLGTMLHEASFRIEPTTYTFDVTEFIRNNPSSSYFFAARNFNAFNVRITGIQLSIFYR